jgi:hypothetical protein
MQLHPTTPQSQRPALNPGTDKMRNAYEPPPWLAPQNTPKVASVTGLGTGGGAGVQTADSDGFGAVRVFAGPDATAGGTIVLAFPSPPVVLFMSAPESFGTLSQIPSGNQITVSWTGTPRAGMHQINYEWSVSR